MSLELNKRSQSEPDLAAQPEVVAMTAGEDTAVDNNDNGDEDGNVPVASPSGDDEDDHESRRQSEGSGVRRQNVSSLQLPSMPL